MIGKSLIRLMSRPFVLVCAFVALASVSTFAQGVSVGSPTAARPTPTPQAKTSPSPERSFFKNILRDQRAIWTSPFHLDRGDAKWLAPIGLSTAALLATDRETAEALGDEHRTLLRVSKGISQGGSLYTTGGVVAAFYLVGRAKHNARARETGVLGAEALIDGELVASALKLATQRPRPREDNGSGEFFEGGRAFPSGHAVSSWALATVIAHEYGRRRPLVRFGAYGLATAVSLSRFTARKHFLGDVLAGSAIGYGVGRYVYRTHHDPSLDEGEGGASGAGKHSRLMPFTSPIYYRASHSVGLMLVWTF